MNWWYILLVIGLTQGIFLILVILTVQKMNVIINRYLAILIFAIVTPIALELAIWHNLFQLSKILRLLAIASVMLIGPSLYLYYKLTIRPINSNKKNHLLHFFPFFLLFIFLIIIESNFNSVSHPPAGKLPWYVAIAEVFKLIHLSSYFIISFYVLNKFSQKKDHILFEGHSKTILLCGRLLLLLLSGSVIFSGLFLVFDKYMNIELLIGNPSFIKLLLVICIYLLAFMAIRFPIVVVTERDNLIVKRAPKYNSSTLNKEEVKEWKSILLSYLYHEKPYLDDKLKIEHLAKAIGISSRNLSQIVNQEFGKQFKDFINYFRVEEFKKRILDPTESNKTILAIAYESGFSSKASFNRIFKSLTSVTPKEYKNSNSLTK